MLTWFNISKRNAIYVFVLLFIIGFTPIKGLAQNDSLKDGMMLSLNTKSTTLDSFRYVKYCFTYYNSLPNTRILPKHIMVGIGDYFIENDFYFKVFFSENNDKFLPYNATNSASISYPEYHRDKIELQQGESYAYPCYNFYGLYKFQHKGYYKIQCVTGKQLSNYKVNPVILQVK